MKNIFDTHCHPFLNTKKNQNKVIEDFFKNGGKKMLIVGTNLEKSLKAIHLAKKYEGVYASIGIHPCDVYDLDLKESLNELKELYNQNKDKVIAIGECGLDYYWLRVDEKILFLDNGKKEKIIKEKKAKQKKFFKGQLELAKELDLPVIIHNRESKDDILYILKKQDFKNFVYHCYTENLDYANKLIEFSQDCKISFSGIVTFNKAEDIQETAKNIPLKNIIAETDSPYLTPTPYRGKEENEPIYTKYVIEKINELRGKDCFNEIYNNSVEFFGIKNS